MLPLAFLYEKANSKKFWSDTHAHDVTPGNTHFPFFSHTCGPLVSPLHTLLPAALAHIMEFSFSKKAVVLMARFGIHNRMDVCCSS